MSLVSNAFYNINLVLVLLSMIFCHIVDDFYLQGCLANMKQAKWWEQYGDFYRNDYKPALFLHAFSWTFCIYIPIFIHCLYYGGSYSIILLLSVFVVNWIIHAVVDNLKANEFKINLITDQTIHILQIFVTWTIYIFNY